MFQKKTQNQTSKLVKPAGVEHDLTDRELSDFVVFSREIKVKETEIKHWQKEIRDLFELVAARVKATPPKYVVDWSHVFENGKIYVLKNRAPKVKVGKEERQPINEPRLQK